MLRIAGEPAHSQVHCDVTIKPQLRSYGRMAVSTICPEECPLYSAGNMVPFRLPTQSTITATSTDGSEAISSVFSYACLGNIQAMKETVDAAESRDALFRITDYAGRTPLHLAATNGHLEMVKFLVQEGAPLEEVWLCCIVLVET